MQKESWEIRQVALLLFNGDSVEDDVIQPLYKKWEFAFDTFNYLLVNDSGSFSNYPIPNEPFWNQPHKLIKILNLLRSIWHEINERKLKNQGS